jgi:hypothetical protein
LHGISLAELDSPKFYLPDNISIVTRDAVQQLEDISPTDIQRLHNVHTEMHLPRTLDQGMRTNKDVFFLHHTQYSLHTEAARKFPVT